MTDFPDFGIIVERLAPTGLRPGQLLFYGVAGATIPGNGSATLTLGTVPTGERWIFYRIWISSFDNALSQVAFERSGTILSRSIGYFNVSIDSPSGIDAYQGDTVKIIIFNHASFDREIFISWAAIEELL
jgi:hypothetical protein